MPCYDPGYREDRSYSRSEAYLDNAKQELTLTHSELNKQKDKNAQLEASLCAILRELEKSNNSHIIEQAEKNGKVNIKQFKKDHFAEDDKRINILLDNLSEHEKQMLKDKLK